MFSTVSCVLLILTVLEVRFFKLSWSNFNTDFAFGSRSYNPCPFYFGHQHTVRGRGRDSLQCVYSHTTGLLLQEKSAQTTWLTARLKLRATNWETCLLLQYDSYFDIYGLVVWGKTEFSCLEEDHRARVRAAQARTWWEPVFPCGNWAYCLRLTHPLGRSSRYLPGMLPPGALVWSLQDSTSSI